MLTYITSDAEAYFPGAAGQPPALHKPGSLPLPPFLCSCSFSFLRVERSGYRSLRCHTLRDLSQVGCQSQGLSFSIHEMELLTWDICLLLQI